MNRLGKFKLFRLIASSQLKMSVEGLCVPSNEKNVKFIQNS